MFGPCHKEGRAARGGAISNTVTYGSYAGEVLVTGNLTRQIVDEYDRTGIPSSIRSYERGQ